VIPTHKLPSECRCVLQTAAYSFVFLVFPWDNFLLVNRSRFAIKGAFDCQFNCMIIELACGLFSEILLLYPLVKLCILNFRLGPTLCWICATNNKGCLKWPL